MQADPAVRIRDDVRDPELVVHLFSQTDWAENRTRASIEAGIANTDLVLTAWLEDDCIGMLRVLTDHVYRAFIEDVVIDERYRLQGYGTALVNAALRHPDVAGVECVYLATTRTHFYERLGFEPQVWEDGGWMIYRPAKGKG